MGCGSVKTQSEKPSEEENPEKNKKSLFYNLKSKQA